MPQYTPLVVADLTRSFCFYRDLVGLRPQFVEVEDRYAEFSLGAGTLALAEITALSVVKERTSLQITPASRGRQQLLFNVDDVQVVVDRLSAARVTVEAGDQPWITAFYDPDGNQVCIMPH